MQLAAVKEMGHVAQARANEANFRFKKVIGVDIENMYSPEAIRGAQRIGLKVQNPQAATPATGGGGPDLSKYIKK